MTSPFTILARASARRNAPLTASAMSVECLRAGIESAWSRAAVSRLSTNPASSLTLPEMIRMGRAQSAGASPKVPSSSIER